MTTIAATWLLSLATAAAPPPIFTQTPIVVNLTRPSNVSETLMTEIIAECDAVWRRAGFSFVWRRAPWIASAIHVAITDQPRRSNIGTIPLGWIPFENGRPSPDIVISRANAEEYMGTARDVIGETGRMPRAEYELLLGRVLGRALAHELAHYLLETKLHTLTGLLQAAHSAYEFFSSDRSAFQLDTGQRAQVAARLRRETPTAS